MPTVPITTQVPDMNANVSQERAEECKFAFFQDIQSCDQCPEFIGCNMKLSREQGHTLKAKTKIVYLPLIDRPPADSVTMMMALLRAQRSVKYCRAEVCDLYSYIVLHCMSFGRTRLDLTIST